jgi:hypothetical protein
MNQSKKYLKPIAYLIALLLFNTNTNTFAEPRIANSDGYKIEPAPLSKTVQISPKKIAILTPTAAAQNKKLVDEVRVANKLNVINQQKSNKPLAMPIPIKLASEVVINTDKENVASAVNVLSTPNASLNKNARGLKVIQDGEIKLEHIEPVKSAKELMLEKIKEIKRLQAEKLQAEKNIELPVDTSAGAEIDKVVKNKDIKNVTNTKITKNAKKELPMNNININKSEADEKIAANLKELQILKQEIAILRGELRESADAKKSMPSKNDNSINNNNHNNNHNFDR